jgi:hypothetical protein
MIAAIRSNARDLPPILPRIRLTDVLGDWPSPLPWKQELGPEQVQRLTIPSEMDLNIPAVLARKPRMNVRGVILAADDRGKEAVFADPAIRIGEMATSKPTWTFAISLMQGENMVWRQTCDLVRSIEALTSVPEFRGKPVGLYTRGTDATIAGAYMLAWSADAKSIKLGWFLARDGFLTYHAFLDRPKSMPMSYRLAIDDRNHGGPLDHEIPAIYYAFDALNQFDIPQLLEAPGIPGLVINPMNGDWERMQAPQARRLVSGRIQIVSETTPEHAIQRFLRALVDEPGGREQEK